MTTLEGLARVRPPVDRLPWHGLTVRRYRETQRLQISIVKATRESRQEGEAL